MNPDEDEVTNLLARLNELDNRLEEGTRQLKLILKWFGEFENLVSWMYINGFWDAEDVDEKNPMLTYKNGLKRFCKEHNIKLTKRKD